MSFSARRIGILSAILLAAVAFFALQAAGSGDAPNGADGITVVPSGPAPSVSTTPPAHPDGAIWG